MPEAGKMLITLSASSRQLIMVGSRNEAEVSRGDCAHELFGFGVRLNQLK